jgi:excisionase family DNA binding protein
MSAVLTPADASAKLLDVQAVAELLGCSTRHVYRLSDAGRMPAPVKLGALVRWSASAIRQWIDAGCPAVRSMKGAHR